VGLKKTGREDTVVRRLPIEIALDGHVEKTETPAWWRTEKGCSGEKKSSRA